MGLPQRDSALHTYAEYLTWPDDARYELIDGVAYRMAPAPTLDHQDFVGEIYMQLRRALDGTPCRVFIAPVDLRLPKANEADEQIDTVVQPDVLVVCQESKLDRRGVRGAPDLVIEVLSPSSATHDHLMKRRAYERARVREYWLVHPSDRMVTLYLLEGNEFSKPEVRDLSRPTPVGILPGVCIAWDALLERVPPPEY
jgi:Uma2 family endonuclease